MSFTIGVGERREWASYTGLLDYGDYSDKTEEINVRPDGFEVTAGDWYYVAEATELVTDEEGREYRAIYSGSWGNYNSPGSDESTWVELYDLTNPDEVKEFEDECVRLQGLPEESEVEVGVCECGCAITIIYGEDDDQPVCRGCGQIGLDNP